MASAALDVLVDVGQTESDRQWVSDIRYSLRGSARTGDCLHEFFEELGKDFSVNSEAVLRRCLRRHGLDIPDAAAIRSVNGVDAEALLMERLQERRQAILAWLQSAMQQPLRATEPAFCLQDVLATGGALPEAGFDFAIGSADSVASIDAAINHALRAAGVADISLPFRKQLRGLMTGSIDLLFIHNKKIYVLDYKSNTLGKAPRFYSHQHMEQEMRDNRYDLQAMIYAVAAHRYMKHRLGGRYAFDGGEYSFGGVFYLFLRGMGLPAYPGHGVWFQRPTVGQLMALDTAFAGEGMVNEGVANA
jgi:exodeoxyribonuclease V beta subunit